MKPISSPLRLGALLALGLLGAVAARAQTSVLYGVTFFNNELVTVDPSTGTGSLVTVLSEPLSPYGLAFLGERLYTFDSDSDRIREINRTTGLVSGSIDISVGDLIGEGDIAFRADGMGFLSSALTPEFEIANDLFRFDLNTGTSVRIGTTDLVLDGLAFSNNTLYAIGQESAATLYIVDQQTGALTPVGLLGLAMNSPFGALTAGPNGFLYGSVDDRLYAISPVTGLASELSVDVLDIGFGSVSGLAFAPAGITPVPEPSTYGLMGVAALLIISFVRKYRTRASPLTV